MAKTRRLQVLIEDEQWARLEVAAAERRMSVGAIVREAIERSVPGDLERGLESFAVQDGLGAFDAVLAAATIRAERRSCRRIGASPASRRSGTSIPPLRDPPSPSDPPEA